MRKKEEKDKKTLVRKSLLLALSSYYTAIVFV
jgi:hypothetical protein